MTPHVRPLLGWSVGRRRLVGSLPGIISCKEQEIKLQCYYRSTCFPSGLAVRKWPIAATQG